MTIKEAILKQVLWGTKKCSHLNIQPLNNSEFPDGDSNWVTRTGDYVCTTCGKIWSEEEYEQDFLNLNK